MQLLPDPVSHARLVMRVNLHKTSDPKTRFKTFFGSRPSDKKRGKAKELVFSGKHIKTNDVKVAKAKG